MKNITIAILFLTFITFNSSLYAKDKVTQPLVLLDHMMNYGEKIDPKFNQGVRLVGKNLENNKDCYLKLNHKSFSSSWFELNTTFTEPPFYSNLRTSIQTDKEIKKNTNSLVKANDSYSKINLEVEKKDDNVFVSINSHKDQSLSCVFNLTENASLPPTSADCKGYNHIVEKPIATCRFLKNLKNPTYPIISANFSINELSMLACYPGKNVYEFHGPSFAVKDLVLDTQGKVPPYSLLDLNSKPFLSAVTFNDKIIANSERTEGNFSRYNFEYNRQTRLLTIYKKYHDEWSLSSATVHAQFICQESE